MHFIGLIFTKLDKAINLSDTKLSEHCLTAYMLQKHLFNNCMLFRAWQAQQRHRASFLRWNNSAVAWKEHYLYRPAPAVIINVLLFLNCKSSVHVFGFLYLFVRCSIFDIFLFFLKMFQTRVCTPKPRILFRFHGRLELSSKLQDLVYLSLTSNCLLQNAFKFLFGQVSFDETSSS